MILVILLAQIELNRSTFKYTLLLARGLVDNSRDASIRCSESDGILEGIETGGEWHVRLIFKNHSSFCVFFEMSILCALYFTPNSSSVMLILWPFGVPPEYLFARK